MDAGQSASRHQSANGIRNLAIRNLQLLALLVRRVLSTEATKLGELEPLGRLLLVLRRAVVAPLALLARQGDDVSHNFAKGAGGW
jgi:hypothetical protein